MRIFRIGSIRNIPILGCSYIDFDYRPIKFKVMKRFGILNSACDAYN